MRVILTCFMLAQNSAIQFFQPAISTAAARNPSPHRLALMPFLGLQFAYVVIMPFAHYSRGPIFHHCRGPSWRAAGLAFRPGLGARLYTRC